MPLIFLLAVMATALIHQHPPHHSCTAGSIAALTTNCAVRP